MSEGREGGGGTALRSLLGKFVVTMGVDAAGSGSCSMASFGISGFEPFTKDLDYNFRSTFFASLHFKWS
jgi:hypothetical protein